MSDHPHSLDHVRAQETWARTRFIRAVNPFSVASGNRPIPLGRYCLGLGGQKYGLVVQTGLAFDDPSETVYSLLSVFPAKGRPDFYRFVAKKSLEVDLVNERNQYVNPFNGIQNIEDMARRLRAIEVATTLMGQFVVDPNFLTRQL